MKHAILSPLVAGVVALALIAGGGLLADQTEVMPLQQLFGEDYEACGLNKLDRTEQNLLLESIAAGGSVFSYTGESAVRYLEKEGWRRVRVLGAVRESDIGSDRNLIAFHDYSLYSLDATVKPYLLEPGVYWANISGSTWVVIYPEGDEVRFWAKEVERAR
ncbi:hypothetical protein GF420_03090 [candidate division GN15 bacterium]|nr:hypothetical protein [candidate division GN15 bacterium]